MLCADGSLTGTATVTHQRVPDLGKLINVRHRTPEHWNNGLIWFIHHPPLSCLYAWRHRISPLNKIYHSPWLAPAFTAETALYLRKPGEKVLPGFFEWHERLACIQCKWPQQGRPVIQFLVYNTSLSSPLWGSALSGHSQCADLNREQSCCSNIASFSAQ